MNDEFGQHLTIDASECNVRKLGSISLVYDILRELPKMIGMTIMTLPYVGKWKDVWAESEGISGFVMIAESHISIHTFPEQKYVFIDVFSCKKFNTEKAKEYLIEMFNAKKIIFKVIKRGLDFPRNRELENNIFCPANAGRLSRLKTHGGVN